jgi:hypothetical protein
VDYRTLPKPVNAKDAVVFILLYIFTLFYIFIFFYALIVHFLFLRL